MAWSSVERVVSGGRVEDDLVDAKFELPAAEKAPRSLAALENRARGREILWLVGLDEDGHRVAEAADEPDLAAWWPQVGKAFDPGPPDLLDHVRVHVGDGRAVMALRWDTAARPFMVRTKSGALEIPWRDGTTTRSIHRHELIALMHDEVARPLVSVNVGYGRLEDMGGPEPVRAVRIVNNLELLVAPHLGSSCFVAQAGSTLTLGPPLDIRVDAEFDADDGVASFHSPRVLRLKGVHTVHWRDNDGLLDLVAEVDSLRLSAHLHVVGQQPIDIDADMPRVSANQRSVDFAFKGY